MTEQKTIRILFFDEQRGWVEDTIEKPITDEKPTEEEAPEQTPVQE